MASVLRAEKVSIVSRRKKIRCVSRSYRRERDGGRFSAMSDDSLEKEISLSCGRETLWMKRRKRKRKRKRK